MSGDAYRICNRCVMDTSDPDIRFDERGNCNHCETYFARAKNELFDHESPEVRLGPLIDEIRAARGKADYDCIIGISGGIDSTYVAYKTRQFGLKPLAVHLDNGWNSNLAVTNIHRTLKTLDIDLHTVVLDWPEFRALQMSFLKASTPDCEIPTDHAIQAVLYEMARKVGVRYVLGGSNYTTESIMPRAWSHGMRDWKYIKSVHRRHGRVPLRSYPHFSLSRFAYDTFVRGIQLVYLLNYMPYVKDEAMQELRRELDWVDYGGKHYESIYTRFFHGFILPTKFGYDKRRGHLSTLICSGQMSRDDALDELARSPYPSVELLAEDREFVLKKLEISNAQFESMMRATPKSFADYPSYERHPLYKFALKTYRSYRKASLRRRQSRPAPTLAPLPQWAQAPARVAESVENSVETAGREVEQIR